MDALARVLIEETTTLGVRTYAAGRRKLARRTERFKITLGTVRIKISTLEGMDAKTSPEYDDCEAIARRKGIPLRRVMETVAQEFALRGTRRTVKRRRAK